MTNYNDYNYNPQQPGYVQPNPGYRTGHSGLGIASFIMSMVCVVGFIVLMVVATTKALQLQKSNASPQQMPEEFMAVGCGIIVIALLALVGLILGIIGCLDKMRSRLFAILGIVFNGLVVLFFLFCMLLGLANR